MDYLNVARLAESDFDTIIESIGGHRFSEDHSKEERLNCDYEYADALIELKLVEEDPAEKKSKQDKLAELFKGKARTAVIDPELLSHHGKAAYYRILESPIKTALKKASKQLQEASKTRGEAVRVTILINNGLTLMMPEEFEDVAIKCAKNDTSGIDILLVGGLYYFSDKFDAYTILPLKEVYLKKRREDIVDSIRKGWGEFLNIFMNRQILDEDIVRNKEPLKDISFTVGNVLYVKPPPRFGKPSSFWPDGIRPREDTTGLDICPPVARILPELDADSYKIAASSIKDDWMLKEDLRSYAAWLSDEMKQKISLARPLIAVRVPAEKAGVESFHDLCAAAADIFNMEIHRIIEAASEFTETHQSLNYILLKCVEIGIDKANDISYIEHFIEFPGLERNSLIIDGERLFFEHALAVASAYCIKVGADCVYYRRNEKYKWT